MFMINYELVYGKSSKIFHKPNNKCDCTYKENQAEEPECISSEQNTHKNASLKNDVSAVSGFAANAGAILKSEETAPKHNSLKGKAGAVVSGLGSSLTGLKKKASDLTENISTSVEQKKIAKIIMKVIISMKNQMKLNIVTVYANRLQPKEKYFISRISILW